MRSVLKQPLFAYATLVALVLTLQFSPIAGLVAYRLTGASSWSMISISRDVLILLLGAAVFSQSLLRLRITRWTNSVTWAFLTLITLTFFALISTADIASVALNLRRLFFFPLLFFVVAAARLSQSQILALIRLIFNTTVIVAILGIAEFFAPDSLWRDFLKVVDFFSSNPFDPFGALPFEETGRFFSWDLQSVIGGSIRRAVSTYLEPTTLAAALICGTCLAAAARRSGQDGAGIKLALILICGALTISKAFGLFLIAMVLYVYLRFPSPTWIFPLTIIGGLFASWASSLGLIEGKFEHVAGLASAINHFIKGSFIGEGIGNAGNYAGLDSEIEVGAESGLGNFLAQVGFGALIYLFWIQSVASDVIKRARERQDRTGIYFASMLLGWFISFLFSASSLGVGGNGLIFLSLSLYLHQNYPSTHYISTVRK